MLTAVRGLEPVRAVAAVIRAHGSASDTAEATVAWMLAAQVCAKAPDGTIILRVSASPYLLLASWGFRLGRLHLAASEPSTPQGKG